MLRRWVSFLLVAFALIFSARATVYELLALDDLTGESQTVVYGKVLTSRVEWNSARTMIFTIYEVQALEYLKGNLGPVFQLHEPGGELNGMSMSISGVPKFSAGQEAVFFVWTSHQGLRQVTGFEQGHLPVVTDSVTGLKSVSRSIPLGSARTPLAIGQQAPASSLQLPQLLLQIRSSAIKQSQPTENQ